MVDGYVFEVEVWCIGVRGEIDFLGLIDIDRMRFVEIDDVDVVVGWGVRVVVVVRDYGIVEVDVVIESVG